MGYFEVKWDNAMFCNSKYSNIIITDTVTNSFIVSASAFAHLQSMLPTAAGWTYLKIKTNNVTTVLELSRSFLYV